MVRGMEMIKLLVSDMDGTMLNSTPKLSERNIQAVKLIQERGVKVALASGRGVNNLAEYAQELELNKHDGFLIGSNGQEIYSYKTNQCERKAKIPVEIVKKIVNYALDNKLAISGNSSDNNKSYYYRPEGSLSVLFKDVQMINFDENTMFFSDEVDLDKMGLNLYNGFDANQAYDDLKEIIQGQAEVYQVSNVRIEFCGPNINKVNAVDQIVELLGFEDDEVLVLGDGFNDIKMLKKYPNSVAMANAFKEVKEAAHYITASNNDHGVALAIEKFIGD